MNSETKKIISAIGQALIDRSPIDTELPRTELMDYFIHLPNHSDNMWDWLLEWAKKEAARKTFDFVERFRLTDEEGGFDVALIGAILQVWLTPEKKEEIPHFEPRLQEYCNHSDDAEEHQQLMGVLRSLHFGEFGLQEASMTPVFNSTALPDQSINQSMSRNTTNRRLSLSDTITSLSNSFNDSPMVSNKKRKLMSNLVRENELENEDLLAENQDLKSQIDELKSILDQKDREALKFADYESTKEELSRVYQQCEEYKVENQRLKKLSRENEVLKDKLSKARDEKNEGIWQLDDLTKENAMLKSDLERATRSAESLSEKNKELEAQVEDLMEKHAALNESLPPEEARANASGLAEVSLSSEPPSFSKLNNTGTPSLQLEMELEKIKTEFEQERSAHEITRQEVERLTSQVNSMISEVENVNEQSAESNKLEVKVDRDNRLSLKVDLNDRSEECERLGNQMNHLQERIRAQSLSSRELKATLANTTGQLEEQKSLITTREIEMKTLQSSKATLENELHQLVSNHDVVLKEKNEEIRTLQNDLVASKSLVDERKVVISGLEEQLKRRSDELLQNQAEAQKKLLTVTHEKHSLDAAMNALKIQSDSRIRELEKQVAQLMEALDKEKSNAEIVSKSFEAKIAKKEKMISQYKAQEEQMLVIQGKYQNLKSTSSKAAEQLEKEKTKRNESEVQLKGAKQKEIELQKKVRESETRLENGMAALRDKQTLLKAHEDQIKSLQMTLDEQNLTISRIKCENSRLIDDNSHLKKELETFSSDSTLQFAHNNSTLATPLESTLQHSSTEFGRNNATLNSSNLAQHDRYHNNLHASSFNTNSNQKDRVSSLTVNDKLQRTMLDPQDEEDDDQLTSTGIQQLLDSKELKKTNVAPSISRTTSATAIPKPNVFGYDPHGRSSELVQRNKRAAPHLRSSYALETDLTPTKSLDKNLDITTSSIQSNQFNAGIDDHSASTPQRSDRTFKVPKTETVLKETTSKRNMPVESEEKPKRRRSIRGLIGRKSHK